MTTIELNTDQADALKHLLERALGDMSVEIADTDRKSFRDELKLVRDNLKRVHEQLQ